MLFSRLVPLVPHTQCLNSIFLCALSDICLFVSQSLSFFLSFFLSCFPLSFLLYHMALLMMTTAATAETEAEAATTK